MGFTNILQPSIPIFANNGDSGNSVPVNAYVANDDTPYAAADGSIYVSE